MTEQLILAQLRHKIAKAKEATNVLRDHARIHGMGFRERDPLVVAIHDALDAILEAQPPETAPTLLVTRTVILRCPWCQHEWATVHAADEYDFCPSCHGAFSFQKPRLAAPTPDPPTETPTPPCPNCGGDGWVLGGFDGEMGTPCSSCQSRPADTPTGLAPLTEEERAELDTILAEIFLPTFTARERDIARRAAQSAQRQASASVRREAIEDCIGVISRRSFASMVNASEVIAILQSERDRKPSVSPRPTSGEPK